MPDYTDLIARLKALYPSENHWPTIHEAIAALAASRPEPTAAPDVAALVADINYLVKFPYERINATSAERLRQAAAALLAQQQRIAELEANSLIDASSAQDDLAEILRAVGLPDSARPYSPHEVVQRELLPRLAALAAARRVPREPTEAICKHEWIVGKKWTKCRLCKMTVGPTGAEDANG